ncbi:MAG TPA: hypothetical protein VL424_10675 [Pararobbsia sp.]|nr:hypothetical protein [Pararobbsia sp.]
MNDVSDRVDITPEEKIATAYATRVETQFLHDVEAAMKHNACDERITASSAASCVVLALRSVIDACLRIATLISPEAQTLVAATHHTSVWSTIVLGPIIATASIVTGAVHVHQARKIVKELARDRKVIDNAASQECLPADSHVVEYLKFIARKLTSRQRFASRFLRCSVLNLAVTCLVSAVTITFAGLGIVAIVVAAPILLSPFVLAGLALISIFGGVAAFLTSRHIVKGPGKGKRQQSYRSCESRYLSRRFDSLHSLYSRDFWQQKQGPYTSGLRADLYGFMQQRDAIRQAFLHAVAADSNKYFAWHARATDDESVRGCVSKKWQPLKNVGARMRFVGTYLRQRVKGATRADARQAAAQVHARHADRLTVAHLANWLAGTDVLANVKHRAAPYQRETAQFALLKEILHLHHAFLQSKTQAFEAFRPAFFDYEGAHPETEAAFLDAGEEHEQDCVQLDRIGMLLDAELSIEQLKRGFLLLHLAGSETVPDDADTYEINTRLARCLIEEMPVEFTTQRGVLFDMHRNACNLCWPIK